MAREAPIGVRLSPETTERLRTFANARGRSVHAEIVRAVEELLTREGGEPEVAAVRVATDSLFDRFSWMASTPEETPEDHRRFALALARAATANLMVLLGATEHPGAKTMGEQAAWYVVRQMQKRDETPLGEAGRVLDVKAKP